MYLSSFLTDISKLAHLPGLHHFNFLLHCVCVRDLTSAMFVLCPLQEREGCNRTASCKAVFRYHNETSESESSKL